jgi:hypothetical protein
MRRQVPNLPLILRTLSGLQERTNAPRGSTDGGPSLRLLLDRDHVRVVVVMLAAQSRWRQSDDDTTGRRAMLTLHLDLPFHHCLSEPRDLCLFIRGLRG